MTRPVGKAVASGGQDSMPKKIGLAIRSQWPVSVQQVQIKPAQIHIIGIMSYH